MSKKKREPPPASCTSSNFQQSPAAARLDSSFSNSSAPPVLFLRKPCGNASAFVGEGLNAWEFAPAQKLQRSASPCRYVRDFIRHAGLMYRGHRVASTYNGSGARSSRI